MLHTRQSKSDSGLGLQANALETFYVVLSSIGGGEEPTSGMEDP